jgi:hypothetical protein
MSIAEGAAIDSLTHRIRNLAARLHIANALTTTRSTFSE